MDKSQDDTPDPKQPRKRPAQLRAADFVTAHGRTVNEHLVDGVDDYEEHDEESQE